MGSILIKKVGITNIPADAIVNAANEGLWAGGGVCGAIFEAAGYSQLQQACVAIGHCDTGSAVITPAYNLKAKYIIHAVGPRWSGGNHKEPQQLYGAYKKSLELAMANGCHSIVFPLLSAGIFGYPADQAWRKAIQACQDFLVLHPDIQMQITFAVIDDKMLVLGQKTLNELISKKNNSGNPAVNGLTKMESAIFIEDTVCKLNIATITLLKDILLPEYISFSIISPDHVDSAMIGEKLFDYFETSSIKTGRTFDKQIEAFMTDLDAITGPKVSKAPPPKKGDNSPGIVPRARKYYEKAISLKNTKEWNVRQILDYSRIMLCLYAASINHSGATVENFNYSLDSLDPNKILEFMKEREEVSLLLPPVRKKRFDTKDKYSPETCTLVLTTIILCSLINENVEEEQGHE